MLSEQSYLQSESNQSEEFQTFDQRFADPRRLAYELLGPNVMQILEERIATSEIYYRPFEYYPAEPGFNDFESYGLSVLVPCLDYTLIINIPNAEPNTVMNAYEISFVKETDIKRIFLENGDAVDPSLYYDDSVSAAGSLRFVRSAGILLQALHELTQGGMSILQIFATDKARANMYGRVLDANGLDRYVGESIMFREIQNRKAA